MSSSYAKFFNTTQQIAEGNVPDEIKSQIKLIPRDKIRPGLIQYRLWFDPDRIEALAKVFRETGFIGALILHPDPVDDGYYRLIGGERSWRAGGINSMASMPSFVETGLTETQIAELAFSLNSAAEQLSQYENTLGTLDILRRNLNVELNEVTSLLYGMDADLRNWRKGNKKYRGVPPASQFTNRIGAQVVEEVFSRIAIPTQWPGFVKNWMPSTNFPQPLKDAIIKGELSPSKATILSRVDPKRLPQLIAVAIDNKMTVADTKALVDIDPAKLPALLEKARTEDISLVEAKAMVTEPAPAKRQTVLQKRARKITEAVGTIRKLPPDKQNRLVVLFDEIEQILEAKS